MFVFISYLTVPAEDRDRLERHFQERSRLVDSFPGFRHLQLLAPRSGDSRFTFLTAWDSKDAFARYMRSVEHATSHSREPASLVARAQVRHEAIDVLMDSRDEAACPRR